MAIALPLLCEHYRPYEQTLYFCLFPTPESLPYRKISLKRLWNVEEVVPHHVRLLLSKPLCRSTSRYLKDIRGHTWETYLQPSILKIVLVNIWCNLQNINHVPGWSSSATAAEIKTEYNFQWAHNFIEKTRQIFKNQNTLARKASQKEQHCDP